MSELSEKALLLHEKMLEEPADFLFSQAQLMALLKIPNANELLVVAQELTTHRLVKLLRHGDELRFQAVSTAEASKITSMLDDEAMIYSYIEASAREGIWTKTLKAKTNLHQHIVVRCLKLLENQRYIKSIKSVKHPTRKIYMLYNLQPSIDVTGGPWFTDLELDTEFIDSLTTVIWRFAASKTYPSSFKPPLDSTNILQASFPTTHTGYVSLKLILEFITANNITNIDLAPTDIRALCDVLVYDDKLEPVLHAPDVFKATWQSVLEAGFGRAYLLPEHQEKISPETRQALTDQPFSLFEHYAAIPEDIKDSDKVFLDSWTRA